MGLENGAAYEEAGISADLAMQANVANIRISLEKAKQMLKAQEKREVLLKSNSGS